MTETDDANAMLRAELEHRRQTHGEGIAKRIAENKPILDRLDAHLGPVDLDWIAKKLLRRKA